MSLPFSSTDDLLSKLLGHLELSSLEDEIRGTVAELSADRETQLRDIVLATLAGIMAAGGMKWPVVWCIMRHLRDRPGEKLRTEAVALLNGSHFIVPQGDGVVFLSASTLKPVPSVPEAVVATVYSLAPLFTLAERFE
jgi:hypothetical protein